jgi:DNA primase
MKRAREQDDTMPMIEKEKIEEIKQSTDIVALINQFVPLKKVGKNYRALCPFHSEKDASFYVNPDKGIFYCFGCKKGGNAITFLMEYEKLDFPSAVMYLAKQLGIELDLTKGMKYKEIYDVNDLASQYFSHCLSTTMGKRGALYLETRKIDSSALKDFRLGYAPASGGLVKFMRQKGVSIDRLQKAGLISMGRELLRDRLIFPIFNLSGRVIGFGGRGIDDCIKPKYLNSPETPIFKKGEILYGLFQGKTAMREQDEAILVEGYFDLLSLYQNGIRNVCAPLGTSLTEKQAVLISRSARKVNILFDGDFSGIKAALRAIGVLINAQIDVFVTNLPKDSDPDTFIHAQGAEKMRSEIASAEDFFHFYKNVTRAETVEQEVTVIKDLMQIISTINDPIRRDRYLKYASRVFNVPVTALEPEVKPAQEKKIEPLDKKVTQEQKIIAMMFNAPDLVSTAREILKPGDFTEQAVKDVYTLLLKTKKIDVDIIQNEQIRQRIYALVMKNEPLDREAFSQALIRYKCGIEEKRIQAQIREAQARGDDAARKKYMKKLNAFKQKMLNIPVEEVATESDVVQ